MVAGRHNLADSKAKSGLDRLREFAASAPDWANLPGDLLTSVADMVHSVRDRIRMTAVCRSWQTSLVDQKLNFPPCLLLTKTGDKCCFYDISGEEILVELDLPEIRGRRCWGSPFGWLVTWGPDLEIQLFNPLSKATRPLPSLRPLNPYLLEKPTLSSSPDDSDFDCIVLAIYSEHCSLAFAKPGDQAWTPIEDIKGVDDAIYFKGSIYACQSTGEILSYQDLRGTLSKAVVFPPLSPTPEEKSI
ncbi:putative F-box protein At5g55150 [Hibiscus syriacus]|uniref:putative F-box protein At5g55150 n=1 Tax=Hibiscus syriacus TaxID=106335 RepID=UPI0019225BEA|nr:putative F-box protein At5g55150 [Hibiscus syriacus]